MCSTLNSIAFVSFHLDMSDDAPSVAGLMSRRRTKKADVGTGEAVETKSSQSVAIMKMAKDIAELDLPCTYDSCHCNVSPRLSTLCACSMLPQH